MSGSLHVFRGNRVVTPEGERAAAIHVAGGRIAAVTQPREVPEGAHVTELGDMPLLPGLVDSHVHVNEPGRTEWEGFATATRAAAAAGVTTIVDMPLNSVPSTATVAALGEKVRSAEQKLAVDVAFWGGVVPDNEGELRRLHEAGVAGFKCFLAPSGVEEFPHVSVAQMTRAMRTLAELDAPLLVHAEDAALVERGAAAVPPAGSAARREHASWAATRPPECELAAVRAVILAAREAGARAHIVHLAAPAAIPELRAARDRGVHVTAETCPHYLWFAAGNAPSGATAWKCAPPIRDSIERARLREALFDGEIDIVASDHSPAPPALKDPAKGDFFAAWGGIASLQIAPLVLWTIISAADGHLADLVKWMSAAPAGLAGLSGRKGAIARGHDADLVAFDPDAETIVDAGRLEHRHKITPYDGSTLRGRVERTWLRGELIYDGGEFPGAPAGRTLLRGQS